MDVAVWYLPFEIMCGLRSPQLQTSIGSAILFSAQHFGTVQIRSCNDHIRLEYHRSD